MKQWIPLKIVFLTGILMLIQYFIPHQSFEFIYEYSIDFIIIIGIFAMVLGIWSLVRVTYEKIKRKAPDRFYSWVILFGLAIMLFTGFFPFRSGNVGDNPSAVAVGDVDFDNDEDVIVANYDTRNVSIFKNMGNGQFVSAYTYEVGNKPSAVTMGNLDNDNDLDIIVANEDAGEISVLFNIAEPDDFQPKKLQITSTKEIDSLMNAGKPKFSKRVVYKAGAKPSALICSDLDGDGYSNDIAVANSESGSISVFVNMGDGNLKEAVDYPLGFNPSSLYAADLNADLVNDIVVGNSASGEIAFLYGNGNGSFSAAEKIPVGSDMITSIATGDFDQNGFVDIAVCAKDVEDNGMLYVLKSDSTQFFGTVENYATGINPVNLLGVDMNMDGNRDLVVTSRGENKLYVHKNDGFGAFSEKKGISAGRDPVGAAFGYLESEEAPSLLAANSLGNNVTTFSNLGNYEFKPGAVLASGDILFLGGGLSNYFNYQLFLNTMIPIQSTMFSLLSLIHI